VFIRGNGGKFDWIDKGLQGGKVKHQRDINAHCTLYGNKVAPSGMVKHQRDINAHCTSKWVAKSWNRGETSARHQRALHPIAVTVIPNYGGVKHQRDSNAHCTGYNRTALHAVW
jgi:hypothetical protein